MEFSCFIIMGFILGFSWSDWHVKLIFANRNSSWGFLRLRPRGCNMGGPLCRYDWRPAETLVASRIHVSGHQALSSWGHWWLRCGPRMLSRSALLELFQAFGTYHVYILLLYIVLVRTHKKMELRHWILMYFVTNTFQVVAVAHSGPTANYFE